MKTIKLFIFVLLIGTTFQLNAELLEKVSGYVKQRITEFDEIDSDRKQELEELSKYISALIEENKEINLTFICTHNSRRSHIAQIWAQTAAEYYKIKNVNCFSGGTEVTAFNKRSVAALKRTGLRIEEVVDSDNPMYRTYYSNEKPPIKGFSKKFTHKINPQENFFAIMVCSDADAACPVVFGATERFAIPYEDPKKFDDTDKESEAYDERSRQIAREMLYVFSKI